MTSDRWEEINRLYNTAVEVEEKDRALFLEKACGEDLELRREVESLLAYDQQAQQFIDRPALQLTAEKLAGDPPSIIALTPACAGAPAPPKERMAHRHGFDNNRNGSYEWVTNYCYS